MKKILMTILCAMFFTFGMVFSANALTIVGNNLPYDSWVINETYWTGNETAQSGPSGIDSVIAPILGDSEELYKSDVSDDPNDVGIGLDSGPAAAWYETTFNFTQTDPTYASIIWLGNQFIANPTHLLVKDGASTPAWYLFDITGLWNGQADIILSDFWAGTTGAISHVTIYGGNGFEVPEPGMVILLGIGLIGLAFYNRKRLLN